MLLKIQVRNNSLKYNKFNNKTIMASRVIMEKNKTNILNMKKFKNKNIKIMQWNARSLPSNRESLENFIYEENIDVILISETWFKITQEYKFKNFIIIREDRLDGKGGTAILINKNMKFKEYKINREYINMDLCQMCAAEILLGSKKIVCVSLYVSPKANISEGQWNSLLNGIKKPCIIGGDFNVHSQAWGCDYEDTKGRRLLEAIEENQLYILNDNNKVISNRICKSIVDITICSSDIAHKIVWDMYNDDLGSDHYPIIMELNEKKIFDETTSNRKWRCSKANWEQYRKEIEEKIETIKISKKEINYDTFVDIVNEAAMKSIPKTEGIVKKRIIKQIWWDEECNTLIKKRREAEKKYRKNMNLENYLQCNLVKNEVRAKLKQKKKESWDNYIKTLNPNTPTKQIYSMIKRLKNIGEDTEKENKRCDNNWIDMLLNKIAPMGVKDSCMRLQYLKDKNYIKEVMKPFNIWEMDVAMNRRKDTAPGIDNIHYVMLSELPNIGKEVLLKLINKYWLDTQIVRDWNKYNIILFKKTNGNADNTDNYRPISLASCVAKTKDLMIKRRLEWFVEKNKILSKSQYGFRRGLSTKDNLCKLMVDINLAFSRNNYVVALFCDIKGAYDNVVPSIMFQELIKIGLPFRLVSALTFNIYERNIIVKKDNKIIGERVVNKGLPQGGILSPLLYAIYVRDIDNIWVRGTNIIQYADDILIYVEQRDLNLAFNIMKENIKKLHGWLRDKGLELSDEKSSIGVFTRHRLNDLPTHISTEEHSIAVKNSNKFLGVKLDQKLKFKECIQDIKKKIEKRINLLRVVNKTWWGAHPQTSLELYKTLIRPILDYGSIAYHSSPHVKVLDKVQYRCIRICIGAMKSTPINAMLVESGELPLKLRWKYLIHKYIYKKILRREPNIISGLEELEKLMENNKFWDNKQNIMVDSLNFMKKTNVYKIYENNVNLKKLWFDEGKQFFVNINNEETNIINSRGYEEIYTDGSKVNNEVGCAMIHEKKEFQKLIKLPDFVSVYTAELVAIGEAVKYIKNLNIRRAIVYTDCKSCVEKLISINKKNLFEEAIYTEIRSELENIKLIGNEIKITWIRGHNGIEGNEKVDKLAKIATKQGEKMDIMLKSDVENISKRNVEEEWQKIWDDTVKGKTYKTIENKIRKKTWFKSLKNEDRKFVTTLSRIRLNHGNFPSHLYKIGIRSSAICECGEEDGNIEHIIMKCSRYIKQREEMLDKYYDDKSIIKPIAWICIIRNERNYKILYEFIVKSKLVI